MDLSEVEKELLLIEDRKKYLWKVKNKLRDYARNNDFDMFWTLTFDNNKIADVDDYRFDEMNKWLRKMRDTYGKFRYIAIPERHKSGAIHWHMVTGGFRPVLINSGKKYKNTPIHNCTDWEHGFQMYKKYVVKLKSLIISLNILLRIWLIHLLEKVKRNTGLVKVCLYLQSNMVIKKSKGLI